MEHDIMEDIKQKSVELKVPATITGWRSVGAKSFNAGRRTVREARVKANELQLGKLAFVGAWWILLVVFCGAGKGYLGILWTVLACLYLTLHPDRLAPIGRTVEWHALSGEHLFELLTATLIYGAATTFVAWSIAWNDGALTSPDEPLFYIIASAFLLMSVVALTGVVSYLFLLSHHAMLPRIYFVSTLLLPSMVKHFFPKWMFSRALAELTDEAHIFGAMAAIASFVAYFLLKKWRLIGKTD